MAIHIKKSHKGRLHRHDHIPMDQKIPLETLHKNAHSKSAAVREEANFAISARHFNHK